MATTEERDVPELPELLAEIENTILSYDERTRAGQTLVAMSEITNTLLPLLRDTVAAMIFEVEDIHNEINPVKLAHEDAEEVGTLLGALHAHATATGDTGLAERVTAVLPLLGDEPDDGDDGDDDGDTN